MAFLQMASSPLLELLLLSDDICSTLGISSAAAPPPPLPAAVVICIVGIGCCIRMFGGKLTRGEMNPGAVESGEEVPGDEEAIAIWGCGMVPPGPGGIIKLNRGLCWEPVRCRIFGNERGDGDDIRAPLGNCFFIFRDCNFYCVLKLITTSGRPSSSW
jgi:hypothetical protein